MKHSCSWSFVLTLLAASFLLSGCGRNVETPAGYVGYVSQGSTFGKSEFIKVQTGPTSTGVGWYWDVHNISITPYTYDEVFASDSGTGVLAKDNLAVSFAVHVTFRIRDDSVKEFVEKYSTLGEGESADQIVKTAYNNYVKENIRTYAREEAQRFEGLKIQDNIVEITTNLNTKIKKQLAGTPFDVLNVVVGNIQYPKSVTDAIAAKIAAIQDNERQATVLLTVTQVAAQKRVEAQGIADAMNTINSKLTPEYIQYEAIKAQLAMVNSPNHTTIYIPVGPMGVPLVTDTSRPAAPAKN